jgi:hypothetical protein
MEFLVISQIVLLVLVYLAHVRVQKVEGFREAVCADVEDIVLAVNAWAKRIGDLDEAYEPLRNAARMHSAQLKGAGERIRSIEAEMEGMTRTVDAMIQRDVPLGDDDVRRLRAQILGGNMPGDGMPVIGELSELRQQVEGINSRLGQRLDRMEQREGVALRLIAERAARRIVRQESLLRRFWAWIRRR